MERHDFRAEDPLYTQPLAWFGGRRCRSSTVKGIAAKLHPEWQGVKNLDKQYMAMQ